MNNSRSTPANITFEKLLDSGEFGDVWLGTYNTDKCAIKVFDVIDKDEWEKECRILDKLSDLAKEYSLTKLTHYIHYDMACIVFNYIDGHTVSYLIKKKKIIDRKRILTLATDLIQGINYIHQSDIAHLDIKDDNLMFDGCRFRYIDFGLSKTSTCKIKNVDFGTPYAQPPPSLNKTWESILCIDYWAIGLVCLRWYCMEWNKQYYLNLASEKLDIENIKGDPYYPYYCDLSQDYLFHLIDQIDILWIRIIVLLLLEKDANIRYTNFSIVKEIINIIKNDGYYGEIMDLLEMRGKKI